MAERDDQSRRSGRRRAPRDYDTPYTFGLVPTTDRPHPFQLMEYARLLVLRGRLQDGDFSDDRGGRYQFSEQSGVVLVEGDSEPYWDRDVEPN